MASGTPLHLLVPLYSLTEASSLNHTSVLHLGHPKVLTVTSGSSINTGIDEFAWRLRSAGIHGPGERGGRLSRADDQDTCVTPPGPHLSYAFALKQLVSGSSVELSRASKYRSLGQTSRALSSYRMNIQKCHGSRSTVTFIRYEGPRPLPRQRII